MPSYMSYLRQMAVVDSDDDIQWITVKGNHIPIKKGQSKEDAVKSFFESKGKSSGSKSESKSGQKKTAPKKEKVRTKAEVEQNVNEWFEDYDVESAREWRKAKQKMWEHGVSFETIESIIESGKYNPFDVIEALQDYSHNKIDEMVKESEKKVDNSQKKGKIYTNTMSKIRNFKAKEEGTFDFETGKPKSYPNGYSVSFHQNEPDANGNWKSDYGRYSESDYDKNVETLVKESGGELNIGYFAGTPEVSVWVKDRKSAIALMKKHNQHSIWDWEKGEIIENADYDPKKNPMKQ